MATSAETKSIFRPARCRLTGDHFVECPGTQVESVYGRREHLKQDYLFTHFHEREVADALLAINHYRFLDAGDVRNKCSRATAFKEYGAANCVEVMSRANYADVYDDIMVRKAAMDRGGGG